MNDQPHTHRRRTLHLATALLLVIGLWIGLLPRAAAQAPGTTPVEVSLQTQMLHGRKYYVHIVKTGQTVYSIAKAYRVESYDAVTHVDIHFMHAGDTVWLPCRGQFSEQAEAERKAEEAAREAEQKAAAEAAHKADQKAAAPTLEAESKAESKPILPTPKTDPTPHTPTTTAKNTTTTTPIASHPTPPVAPRQPGKTIKVALMMPLHLAQIDEISTTKFDVEQRGKKTYRQFEFIEFYEGIRMALDKLTEEGISVELNVVDVSAGTAEQVESSFASHRVAECDVLIALLLRDAFSKAAELAQQAGIYIVNPMATRSEICATNPYAIKVQPSTAGKVATMLANIKLEHPSGHLYIIHSGSKNEKEILGEMRRQLDQRTDIAYTLFNWSQSAKLTATLKSTTDNIVVSLYDQGRDLNRVYTSNLLNSLSSIKSNPPTLYTLTDWTQDYPDIDFLQLQHASYHTFATAWDMTNETHVGFLQDFRSRYATEPTSILAPTAYDLTLYIVRGLHRLGANFWNTATAGINGLTQPMRLVRSGAGLENERATLYRMDGLRMQPIPTK